MCCQDSHKNLCHDGTQEPDLRHWQTIGCRISLKCQHSLFPSATVSAPEGRKPLPEMATAPCLRQGAATGNTFF